MLWAEMEESPPAGCAPMIVGFRVACISCDSEGPLGRTKAEAVEMWDDLFWERNERK